MACLKRANITPKITFPPLAFSPDSRSLAIGYESSEMKTVDPKTGSQLREFKGQFPEDPFGIASITFSPDGKFLAAGMGGSDGSAFNLWQASTGKLVRFTPGAAYALAFFPDSKTLVGGGSEWRNNTWSMVTMFWDVETGKLKRTLRTPPEQRISSLALSADGRTLVAANDVYDYKTQMSNMEAETRAWDTKSGKVLWSSKEPTVLNPTVAHSPTADVVASFGTDFVWLKESRTGKTIRKLHLEEPMFHPTSLAFSPDGSTLAAGTENSVTLWNVRTGNLAKMLNDHVGPVTCIAYSPDGGLLASGSEDHTVNVWNTKTWEIVSSVGQKYRHIPNPLS